MEIAAIMGIVYALRISSKEWLLAVTARALSTDSLQFSASSEINSITLPKVRPFPGHPAFNDWLRRRYKGPAMLIQCKTSLRPFYLTPQLPMGIRGGGQRLRLLIDFSLCKLALPPGCFFQLSSLINILYSKLSLRVWSRESLQQHQQLKGTDIFK